MESSRELLTSYSKEKYDAARIAKLQGKVRPRIGPGARRVLRDLRGQDVRTNYMPGTDFSKYHTYAWVDEVKGVPRVGGQPDQILDAQVKQAVDSQMAAKGLTKVADGDKADVVLGYQLAIDREKQLNGFAERLGRLRRLGPMGRRPQFVFGDYFNR